MKRLSIALTLLAATILFASCGGEAEPVAQAESVPEPAVVETSVVPFEPAGMSVESDSLILRAHNKDRETLPDSDEVFEFLVANATQTDQPVTIVLTHQDGERWRTSLCVELQCILGDGSEESRTETVTLPPFLEKPFQVHLFVDDEAEAGQTTVLELLVDPMAANVGPQQLTLSAVVAED